MKLNKGARKVISAFEKNKRENCGCKKVDRRVAEELFCPNHLRFHSSIEIEDRAVDQIINKKRGK